MATSAQKVELGDVGSGVAAASLNANTLVTIDTSGLVAACGASGLPVGSIQEAFASGATVNYFRTRGRHAVTASAAIAIGDFLKAASSGKVAPEASVGTRTAATIGIAITAASNDGDVFIMEWL